MKKILTTVFLLLFINSLPIMEDLEWLSSAQNTAGDSTFNSSQIHVIQINFSQPGYWDSLVAYKPLDQKMAASVTINGTVYDSCGVQFKGNSSYNAPGNKKPFKIDFNEYVSGQKFDGLKVINLNNAMKDPTLMREKIFYDFMRRMGFTAPRATYAKLYLNGQYWGLYTLVEQVNKTFLENRFFNDAGNLFKGDPQGSLQWFGPADSSYYSKYELKTNEDSNYWGDLKNLINKINNTPSLQFYDSLEKMLNTQSVINSWAANIIYSNLDSYQGSGHNYYVYHNTQSNKFDWITWDCNETFGNFTQGMTLTQMESLSLFYVPANPPNSRPLTSKMLQNSSYKSAYINTVCQVMENEFTADNLFPIIDSLYNRIKPDVYADTKKPFSNQDFENNINSPVGNNIPGLKSFITNRRNSIISQLAANGCFVGEKESMIQDSGFRIFPNPNNGIFTVIAGEAEPSPLTIYNVFGEMVFQSTVSHQPSAITSNLPAGMYILRVGSRFAKITIVD